MLLSIQLLGVLLITSLVVNGDSVVEPDANGVRTFTFGTDTFLTLLLTKQLFTVDTTPVARNYTVVFKLLDQQPYPSVKCVQLRIGGNNNATLVDQPRYDRNRTHSMEATFSIRNATSVSIHMTVHSSSLPYSSDGLLTATINDAHSMASQWLHPSPRGRSEIQSFTMVYVAKLPPPPPPLPVDDVAATTRPNANHRYNAIGQRQSGDSLLYFRSMIVTNMARFAEREFDYEGSAEQYFTYVGFSFDSPTAVAFVNSSFVQTNRISAIVYDLSVPQFVANMTIFGYDKPMVDFKPIVRT